MRRIAELDGLRGLAAVTVVAYHIFIFRLPWGWAAVDIFFVLSGYLITAIVLKHGRSWAFLPAFYARRGLRIWPIYYLLIMILALRGLDDTAALPYYLTYTQQVPCYWGCEMPPWLLMQHTWTLALEEQFYLIWPALVLLAGRRWTGQLALALAIGSVAARAAGVHWWLLAARSDGFALGGLLAAILADSDAERARRRARGWAAVLGALAVLFVVYLGATGRLVDAGSASILGVHATVASLTSFALVAMLVCHAGHPVFAPLRIAPLVYLGTISYGIYLYHHPIVQISFTLKRLFGVGMTPALWSTEGVLTLTAAVASWHLIERPILRLKDRVPYRQAAVESQVEEPPFPALVSNKVLTAPPE